VGDGGIDLVTLSGYFADWTFVSFEVPAAADRVRVVLRDGSSGSGQAWVAGSVPLRLEVASVAEVVAEADPDVLVSAPLALYFPCVVLAGFEGPVVDAPGLIVQTWGEVWQTTYAAAVSTDRYFRWDVAFDPPLDSERIGAHTGDVDNFVFVSQEYLTGVPARTNGTFTRR
jgi:hypothetical protein